MDRIQKISSYLVICFNCALVWMIIVATLAPWIFSFFADILNLHILTSAGKVISVANSSLNPLQKFIGIMGSSIYHLPTFFGLLILRRLFKNYRSGEIFTTANIKLYQYLGVCFFLYGFLARPLGGMFCELAVTLSNGPGARIISISFGNINLESILCGAVILAISWVMAEAQKIKEDQNFTV